MLYQYKELERNYSQGGKSQSFVTERETACKTIETPKIVTIPPFPARNRTSAKSFVPSWQRWLRWHPLHCGFGSPVFQSLARNQLYRT